MAASTGFPALKLLYVDTDIEALESARRPFAAKGWAALPEDSIYGIPLNRAGHYLKPRINGRTLIEGWLDPQMLYRLSRTPTTMGLRAFGRLAWCDHYRGLMQKIGTHLEAVLTPSALQQTLENTGLALATNRPQVHIIAGLGGGTGSGAFLDAAYSVRTLLKQLGYPNPQVNAMLLAPQDEADLDPQMRANTYAALTELHHYTQPRTKYAANFDERHSAIRDSAKPFHEVVVIPGFIEEQSIEANSRESGVTPRTSISRNSSKTRMPSRRRTIAGEQDPTEDVANVLRLKLFSNFEQTLEASRLKQVHESHSVTPIRSFGLKRFTWPRGTIVERTAQVITPVILMHWVHPDATYIRQSIPKAATELFNRLHLDCEVLCQRLLHLADGEMQQPVQQRVDELIQTIKPRGWLTRIPEPSLVEPVMMQLIQNHWPG